MTTTTTELATAGTDPSAAQHLILVDGAGYVFRAFHALPPMTRTDGLPVNAVFGFTQMLAKFLTDHLCSHIAVVFDASRETFRNAIYPAYKAQRPDPPDELIPQFALVRDATDAFGVCRIEQPGYEADDMMASYARAFLEEAGEAARVTLVSSDKDLMQLVRPGVGMLDPIKNRPIGEAEVIEKFGVPPDRVADVQALWGDSVDNVPGVPGIGVKTAAQLIGEFGDLEGVLANTARIKQPKRREALEANAEQVRISKRLVTLDAHAPLPLAFHALEARAPDRAKLERFLRDQGFRSVLARMGFGESAGDPGTRARHIAVAAAIGAQRTPEAPAADAVPYGPYPAVTTLEALHGWIAEARAAGVVAFDTETDSLDALRARLIGLGLCVAPGRACYIPLAHGLPAPPPDLLDGEGEAAPPPEQIPLAEALDALRPLLTDPAVLKLFQHAKYDLEILARPEHGAIAVAPYDDTMMISYSMHAGRHGHGMDELATRHLGHRPTGYDEVTGTGRARIPFAQVPIERAAAYAGEDADVTMRLWRKLKPQLRAAASLATYEQVERRMVAVLAEMEVAGILVDAPELRRIGEEFATRLVELEADCHRLAGRAFAVGSPKQLGEVLFGEMGHAGGRKGKSGAYSTDASMLEELAGQGVELARRVLDWRQIAKLKTTYVDGLLAAIDPRTGRVHTNFQMAVTSTGRLSSNEPNLQNIPIRTEEGARIRRIFVAAPGHVLLAADYSQIELRLLAHMADVPSLREAFARGEDIHSRTAQEVLGSADREARRRAKMINFGLLYGMSAFGLAARLAIPPGEARAIIDAYFGQYPGIRDFMERVKEDARETGYALTPFGRKIWVPDIAARDMQRRLGAERAAINAPFQGGAAEVIKRAMVRVPRALRDAGLSARMLLQVHDELVFEVPEAEAARTGEVVRGVMEGVAVLRVPLAVDVGSGRSWADAH